MEFENKVLFKLNDEDESVARYLSRNFSLLDLNYVVDRNWKDENNRLVVGLF